MVAVLLEIRTAYRTCPSKSNSLKSLTTFITVSLLLANGLLGQNLAGEWSGELTQDGKNDRFVYTLTLSQDGNKVFGTATSRAADGSNAAKFEVGGLFDGQQLALQEVAQLEPKGAKWCLKHIRLQYAASAENETLAGTWEAEGCKPGKMEIFRKQSADNQSGIKNGATALAQGFPMLGRWTGHLSQSDREYGFYFDMAFQAGGVGVSHIISDGEGGNATHGLRWTFDAASGRLDFEETELQEESVPDWRWCMKSGSLLFEKEENRYTLKGDWAGYIEGFTKQTGACAPGTLYLERPIFKQEELVPATVSTSKPTAATPVGVMDYEKKLKRDVEVERVLEVRNKTLKIRVWDNGTVDGDICTLFLNGDMVLKNYRVTRQKHETIVQLEKPVNYLILHAINLGSITPNTIAVSVYDGVQEQMVIVSSNLETSGAVMIREFTVGKN